ncbi:hypothetical protein CROQUDRAFT_650164 [Cronartium quercuum f. sp. fusiforme G11]|uniref:Uncharacterized protein n=1 Tax=Cronartium quercuum f. sp. fusiforme G11 TaxID=708437 RepID=A0A9P6TIT3_9BASI|nr:hypothetical protein CROQUDRAFT_650164 [Cronartium quercuum f. sp. fusiforme G11]
MVNNKKHHSRTIPLLPDYEHSARVQERLNKSTIKIGRPSGRELDQPHLQDTIDFVNEAFIPKLGVKTSAPLPKDPPKNKRPKLFGNSAQQSDSDYGALITSKPVTHVYSENIMLQPASLPRVSHRAQNLFSLEVDSEPSPSLPHRLNTLALGRPIQIHDRERRGRVEVEGGKGKESRTTRKEEESESFIKLNQLSRKMSSDKDEGQSDDDENQGWEIEPKVPAKVSVANPIAKKDTNREDALMIIEKMGEPWKLVFDKASNSVKADYIKLATNIERLFESDAILAQGMAKQLELCIETASGSRSKIVDESGEVLEAIVQIQTSKSAMQLKLRELQQESRNARADFLKKLSQCQANHAKEIDEMKAEIESERQSFESLIQLTKSDKNEKKDMQKRLAVLLAEESS